MYHVTLKHFPWQVVLALALGVIVPTVFILWMMTEAMQNERLAAYQKINNVYGNQLVNFSNAWKVRWQAKIDRLSQLDRSQAGSAVFSVIREQKLASSSVIHAVDNSDYYPGRMPVTDTLLEDPVLWQEARELEFKYNDFNAAISRYKTIVESGSSEVSVALAYQAWSRCLTKIGKTSQAITILEQKLGDARFRNVKNHQGRVIQINSQLRLLQLLPADEQSDGLRMSIEQRLIRRINDYSDVSLPAQQRLFVMRQLSERGYRFANLEAEALAAEYLSTSNGYNDITENTLISTKMPKVWQLNQNRITALFSEEFIQKEVNQLSRQFRLARGVSIELAPPLASHDNDKSKAAPIGSMLVGNTMPGWRLNLVVWDNSYIDDKADAQIAAYLWTGTLFIFVVLILSTATAWYIYRQLQLHKLKNDLIDTVSHELKTPLSSIRLLVETLIDSDEVFTKRTSEYLQLIDKENKHLARLIDNFLTFSRMEHRRHIFDFETVSAEKILLTALETMNEKLKAAKFTVIVDIASQLPDIEADFSMMVTVLTNLIENSYKYSEGTKYLKLRIYCIKSDMFFEVSDKGIGLNQTDTKKIFERFYRVDQTLTRQTDGCGLGLNIVKYIVEHHHGDVSVSSELGKGSVFTVRVPIELPE